MNPRLLGAFFFAVLAISRAALAQAPPLQIFMFPKPPALQFSAEAIPEPATNRLQTAGGEIPETLYLALATDDTTIAAATEDARLVVLRMVNERPFLRWIVPFFGVSLDVAVGGGMVVVASHNGLVEILTEEYLSGATNLVPTLAMLPTGSPGAAAAVRLADMNGDGRLDLVVVQTGDRARIVVVLADPITGRFSPASPIRVSTAAHGINPMEALPGMNSTDRIAVGVSNIAGEEGVDGDVDLVAVTSTGLGAGCTVEFLENGGGGVMESVAEVPVDPCPRGVLLHDFTGDAREDLVRWHSTSFDSSVALAGGGYGAPVPTEVDGTVTSIAEGSLAIGIAFPSQQGAIDLIDHVSGGVWSRFLRSLRAEAPDRVTTLHRNALPLRILAALMWVTRNGLFFLPTGGPGGQPNRPPVATIAGPAQPRVLTTRMLPDTLSQVADVVLDGSASHDPEGGPVRFEWYFGETLVSTGPVLQHVFPPGVHRIRLFVIETQGSSPLTGDVAISVIVDKGLEGLPDRYTAGQNAPLTVPAPGVLENDLNRNGGGMVTSPAAQPQHGQLTMNTDGTFTYVAEQGFTGEDGFSYLLQDLERGLIDRVDVSIEVVANRRPTARINPERAFTIETDGPTARINLHGRDSSDPDGDPLTYEWSASIGRIPVRPDIRRLGEGPDVTADLPVGTHEVFLIVRDGRGGIDEATLTVEIRRRGAPPGSNTPGGANVEVQPLGMRRGGATVRFALVSSPGHTEISEGVSVLEAPAGFVDLDPPVQVDVTTTAAHDGPVEVCLRPDGGVPEGSIIVHGENGAAADRTSRATATEICAMTSSLSPFAVFRPLTFTPLEFGIEFDTAALSVNVLALDPSAPDPDAMLTGTPEPAMPKAEHSFVRYQSIDALGRPRMMVVALTRSLSHISGRVSSVGTGGQTLEPAAANRFKIAWKLSADGSISGLHQYVEVQTPSGPHVIEAIYDGGSETTLLFVPGQPAPGRLRGLVILRLVTDGDALRIVY